MKNEENILEGIHFYNDEKGNFVFTEKYHLHRGYCCGNGCKHCPYNFENVPEIKKHKLIFQQENEK